jgi:hypothetical protein
VTVRKVYQSAKSEQLDEAMIVEINGREFKAFPHRSNIFNEIDFAGVSVTRDPAGMWNYFRAVFGDQFEEFKEYVQGPESGDIDAEMFGQIVQDMQEFKTGRPTGQSSS